MWSIPASNPEGRAFMALLVAFAVLAVAAFCLRLYSRRIHKNSFDASDYACFCGLVSEDMTLAPLEGKANH